MIYATLLHQIAIFYITFLHHIEIFVRSVLHKMHYFILIRRIGAYLGVARFVKKPYLCTAFRKKSIGGAQHSAHLI